MKQRLLYRTISHEWDLVANERLVELKSGKDRSYTKLIKPVLLRTLKTCDLMRVLDVGCGVGVFTKEIGRIANSVVGVDISEKSIELAHQQSCRKNVEYRLVNVEDYSSESKFSTIVANMTLMTVPDLKNVINKIQSLLIPGGKFVFTITHPSFWPIYWKYNNDPFDYNQESQIVSRFRTRNKKYKYMTRHFHRPISFYLEVLKSNGFEILDFMELKERTERQWYPRFLLVETTILR